MIFIAFMFTTLKLFLSHPQWKGPPILLLQFPELKPYNAKNISNIAGRPEKCQGLARVMRWPLLRVQEVSRPTTQRAPHFLHKLDTPS